ncbi:hypothetical protein OCV73_07375 [Barnesiella propionica]|uniref:hypothetical protein n=1 Tax=Barnesiella propionica TaxID=2981781 RepID=UPI0011C71CA2|nr:hypothetical protein [Barnesiella propionica]MCU6768762.1 hypothetical protein [Barnesiella propionica]
MIKRNIIFLFYFFSVLESFACTSAVISGRVTENGRPLLWKHRDTSAEQNVVVRFSASENSYAFVGLVDSRDTKDTAVWAGYNSEGFAVMNTASYNLKNDTFAIVDKEGVLMKEALGKCRTVKDFSLFLENYPSVRGVEANFGVIDAHGGAAYFEVSNSEIFRFDVKDSPEGYLIRSNYSMAGRKDEGLGYIRYENAQYLLSPVAVKKGLTPEYITGHVSRSFYHSLLGKDMSRTGDNWVVDQDFIPRRSSSASVVVEGVNEGENLQMVTMWTLLGYPPCSVVMPVWLSAPEGVPFLLSRDSTGVSSFCNRVVGLKHQVFPLKRGNGKYYINMELLFGHRSLGIVPQLISLEEYVYRESRIFMREAEKNGGFSGLNVSFFMDRISQKILAAYDRLEISVE